MIRIALIALLCVFVFMISANAGDVLLVPEPGGGATYPVAPKLKPSDRGLETQVDVIDPIDGAQDLNSGSLQFYAEVPTAVAIPMSLNTPDAGTANRDGQASIPLVLYTLDGAPGFGAINGPNRNCAYDNPGADPTDPNDYSCYVEWMFDRDGHARSIRGMRFGGFDAYYNPNTKKSVQDGSKLVIESPDIRRAMLRNAAGDSTEGRWHNDSVTPRDWDSWIQVNPDTNGALRIGQNPSTAVNLPHYCIPGQDDCATGTSLLVTANDYMGSNGHPKSTGSTSTDSGAWGTCTGGDSPTDPGTYVKCITTADCSAYSGSTCGGGWWRDKQLQARPGIHPVMKISDFDARQCWANHGDYNASNVYGNTGKHSQNLPLNAGDLGTMDLNTGSEGGTKNGFARIATGENQSFDTCIQRLVGSSGGFNLSVDRDGAAWPFMTRLAIALTAEDVKFNRLRFASPHNFRSGDGPFKITAETSCSDDEPSGAWLAVTGSGLNYYVSVINSTTVELNMDYQTAVRGHARVRAYTSEIMGVCAGGDYEDLACLVDGDCPDGGGSSTCTVPLPAIQYSVLASSGVTGELLDYVNTNGGSIPGSATGTYSDARSSTGSRSNALLGRGTYTCSNETGDLGETNCTTHAECQESGTDDNAFCYMSPQLLDTEACVLTLTKYGREIPITHPVAQGTGADTHGVTLWGDGTATADTGDMVCASQLMKCEHVYVLPDATADDCVDVQPDTHFMALCY